MASFFSDFKTIWVGLALFVSMLSYAGDTRYMQKSDGDKIVLEIKLANLSQSIDDLENEIAFETDENKLRKLNSMIRRKKNSINELMKLNAIK